MVHQIKIVFMILVIMLVGCDTDTVYYDPPTNCLPHPYQLNMMLRVNEIRQSGTYCNDQYMPPVQPLNWNCTLTEVSKQHATDMATNNFFSHYGSDGLTAGQRIHNAGYTWTIYGENISVGHLTNEDMINAWLNSPAHCRIIMMPDFEDFGFTYVYPYAVQLFGKSLFDIH